MPGKENRGINSRKKMNLSGVAAGEKRESATKVRGLKKAGHQKKRRQGVDKAAAKGKRNEGPPRRPSNGRMKGLSRHDMKINTAQTANNVAQEGKSQRSPGGTRITRERVGGA